MVEITGSFNDQFDDASTTGPTLVVNVQSIGATRECLPCRVWQAEILHITWGFHPNSKSSCKHGDVNKNSSTTPVGDITIKNGNFQDAKAMKVPALVVVNSYHNPLTIVFATPKTCKVPKETLG